MATKEPGALIDLGPLEVMLEEFGDAALQTIEGQTMQRALSLLEKKSAELAPLEKGTLQATTTTAVLGGRGKVVGTLAFTSIYAHRQHELPQTAEWGPGTQAKPGNEFGPAGWKFLERPLRGFVRYLPAEIVKGLQAAWSKSSKG